MGIYKLNIPVSGVFRTTVSIDKVKYVLAEAEEHLEKADLGGLINVEHDDFEIASSNEYQYNLYANVAGMLPFSVEAKNFSEAVDKAEAYFDNVTLGVLEDIEIYDDVVLA